MPLLLTLVRHGETFDNARAIFQGQGGGPLNRLGRAQAARVAERIRRAPPLAIVSSDLERAVGTARIIADACGGAVELDRGLREIDVGTWTGKSYAEIPALFPEEWGAFEQGLDIRRGGGETYAELAVRLEQAVGQIAERYEGRVTDRATVLLVSHGAAIKAFVASMLGLTPRGRRALGGVANASLSVVERDSRGQYILHSWNDVAHLDGLVASEHSDDSVPR